MTEDDARCWLEDRFGQEACDRLATFLDMVVAENALQNLVSPASVANAWSRHAVDSAQLLLLAPPRWQTWIDIGSGGGFPGLVIALLASDRSVTLVEPRRKRAEFLRSCCGALALPNANVLQQKIEAVGGHADILSARAVGSVENLLLAAYHCAKADTTWLLPRGRSGVEEATCLSRLTHSMFHVERSLTDPDSTIIVLTGYGM